MGCVGVGWGGGSGEYTCTSTLILSWIHMFRSLATVAILVALAGNGQLIHNWPMSCGQHTNIH